MLIFVQEVMLNMFECVVDEDTQNLRNFSEHQSRHENCDYIRSCHSVHLSSELDSKGLALMSRSLSS